MSYCRFGHDSDVFVYASGDNVFTCCVCKLARDDMGEWEHGGEAILEHLEKHRQAGHKVPQYAIDILRAELDQRIQPGDLLGAEDSDP
jgi:hypothetical protein